MIKVVELIVRKAGTTREQFHDHWLNVQGPLVMSIPEIRRHNVKCVQSHRLSEWAPFLAGDRPMFEGAAERSIWSDSMDAVLELFSEPKFEKLATGSSLALSTKDVGIAAALARGLGQDAVVADTVHSQLEAALDALGAQVDHSAAIKHWSGSPRYRDTIVETDEAEIRRA